MTTHAFRRVLLTIGRLTASATFLVVTCAGLYADTNTAKKPVAPAKAPAKPATAAKPGTPTGRGGTGTPAAAGRGASAPATRPASLTTGRDVHLTGGGSARVGPRGEVRDVHVGNMEIHRGPNGSRRVLAERPDHSRVFSERGGRGYVEQPYLYDGHEFAHRTYYAHGVSYDRFYRRYPYHGVFLDGYAPTRYYTPALYGWAYNPWSAPVPYLWGWTGDPWATYYGSYFTPYPVYPNASFWLTDYMVSSSLAADYQRQMDVSGGAPPPMAAPPASLTPDVKDLISAEVQRQLALENAEGEQAARNVEPDPVSSGIARMFSDNTPHVFVAGGDLDVMAANGEECALSEGDVVQLTPPVPSAVATARVAVLASKARECGKGSVVSVDFADLQDMQNHMRETIDQGLEDLQSHPAQGGLPALPVSAKAAPTAAPFAAAAPQPDPNAATKINEQIQEADKAEKEAHAQSGTPTGGLPAPPIVAQATISLGQTMDQVVAVLGNPKDVVDLGEKKIYVYNDMKVVFAAGKVSDVQ